MEVEESDRRVNSENKDNFNGEQIINIKFMCLLSEILNKQVEDLKIYFLYIFRCYNNKMIFFVGFLILIVGKLSFQQTIIGCRCDQIQLGDDCISSTQPCSWNNATQTCSLLPCELRTSGNCRVFSDVIIPENTLYECFYNPTEEKCQNTIDKIDCSTFDFSDEQAPDETSEDEIQQVILNTQTASCSDLNCNLDHSTKKCNELVSDCSVLTKKECSLRPYQSVGGSPQIRCIWIQEPWKDETGKCLSEPAAEWKPCESFLSYDTCAPWSRCLWVRKKCVQYICEDLSGTLGRSYCELLYEVNNVTGFNVCLLNREEQFCYAENPALLNSTQCQSLTYNSWFFNVTQKQCQPCVCFVSKKYFQE